MKTIFAIVKNSEGLVSKIGIALSEVALYTAISVPRVMYLFIKSVVIITENPHCGIVASIAPKIGPSFLKKKQYICGGDRTKELRFGCFVRT